MFFEKDITYEDMRMINFLNVKPSVALIKKILRFIQRKIITHTGHGHMKVNINLLWEAISYALSGVIISRHIPRVATLFRNIFKAPDIHDITESDLQKTFKEHFKANVPSPLKEFELFKEKCFEVFEILGH